MKESNTIEGTAFKCQTPGCGKIFRCGSKGEKALRARVEAHMKRNPGHFHFQPTNPKVGMRYCTPAGMLIGPAYDGGSIKDWFKTVQRAGFDMLVPFIKPSFGLDKFYGKGEETARLDNEMFEGGNI